MADRSAVLPAYDLRTWNGTDGVLALVTGEQMGTNCACYVVADTAVHAQEIALKVWALVAACERSWSRFRTDSELVAFNEAAGQMTGHVCVSPLMMSFLRAALWAYEYSNGIVDASMLSAVVEAGYDRDYSLIERTPANPLTVVAESAALRPLSQSLAVSGADDVTVRQPVQVDSGGIGKGLAADLATRLARDAGALGALISLGGDVGARGSDHNGDPWNVAVDQDSSNQTLRSVELVGNEGIATSSTLVRTLPGGHHLIDPRTGRSSRSNVLAATITAPTALEAEVAAKVLVILGTAEGIAFLSEKNLSATVLLTDGRQYGISMRRSSRGAA